jgi:hypothetical protein
MQPHILSYSSTGLLVYPKVQARGSFLAYLMANLAVQNKTLLVSLTLIM